MADLVADLQPSERLGSEQPRLWTPPLRPLTRKTSRGYEVADFAEQVLGMPLLPWQRWLFIHALELDESGGYRYRTVVLLVARQNGKTEALVVLSLWRLFLDGARLVLGTAQDLDIAREAWSKAIEAIEAVPDLEEELAGPPRRTNGDEYLRLSSGGRYKIKAANRKAGRGPSVDLLLMDELREQLDWAAWGALSKTTQARAQGQVWGVSNAGDDRSVVLNHLRDAALTGRDPLIGLFEWSGPEGCDLDDWDAIAQANPGLGHIIGHQAITASLTTDPPDVYRTEVLCQRVEQLDTAVDLAGWKACQDTSGTMGSLRDRIAACVDVAPDGEHVTLSVAAEADDGRIRVEVVDAWKTTDEARVALPELIETIAPVQVGWFPSGPAAALGADLRSLQPPAHVAEAYRHDKKWRYVREIKGTEVTEACQELADLVTSRRILHPDDPLLNAHISHARKLTQGDGWRFVRRGAGHVDAAYSAAGAVRVARTMPEPAKPAVRSAIF